MTASPAPATQPPDVDARALRRVLGRFATGVTIVTCLDAEGRPVGLTANSFNALSLDPPLVLWSLRLSSPSLPAFVAAAHFTINILAESQVELSRRFASSTDHKFAHGPWSPGASGAPVLAGAAAVLECERTLGQTAGDHMLFVGRVRHMTDGAAPPLLFHGGHYHLLGEVL
jgi:flavin reductase (DIM6/NTAB) family NADH-FMN oxidoreductase RutF